MTHFELLANAIDHAMEEHGGDLPERERFSLYGYAKGLWVAKQVSDDELEEVEQRLSLTEEDVMDLEI